MIGLIVGAILIYKGHCILGIIVLLDGLAYICTPRERR